MEGLVKNLGFGYFLLIWLKPIKTRNRDFRISIINGRGIMGQTVLE